ncbi:MAG: hypothetical protein A2161_04960 [Candidatus Schekmanbacteria bacterium RBG_13_48_7]|uniref:Transposase IS4-like domain-containing protein n=1 Tax=Candidatus Schekmanbacteria bacterium RBG_13_48_7 TaxID=1817878 RepID=A0A1F7RLM7_9BACT|nr:MAG: hypothetical protein A2161_04960 [Candidatus Schekmanbacteria bacterium RBG_13_48_7]
MMTEDWPILLSFFPKNWVELASSTNAIKGLHKDKDIENYIRSILIHIACGHSMRETVIRAKMANLANITDVGFLGRLRKSKDWLHSLCVALFEDQGISLHTESDFPVRLFDATNVTEPGKTGSQWRIHYSIQLPSLTCDFFKLTASTGIGTGESFFQYSIKKGDYIIADRGYSTNSGIHHIVSKKAFVIVRVNTSALRIHNLKGEEFPLLKNVTSVTKTGMVRSWNVLLPGRDGTNVRGRICIIRKSNEAIKQAQKKILKEANKKQRSVKPETLEYAKYVILFTNYPENQFSDREVLEWYRIRWQVELTFKRFKSVAQLGHIPKHSDGSSKAWLYGKLFVALLTEKIIEYASSISPWGYILEEYETSKRLA